MGVMRFLVHPPDLLQRWPDLSDAYLSGLDGRIFPTRVEIEDQQIVCRRPLSESAKLNLPWPVPGIGRPMLSTTSLRDREEPYLLPVELARGELAEVRDQWSAWELSGMAIPDAFREKQREAFRRFAHACSKAAGVPDAAAGAHDAIAGACQAAAMLIDAYVIQRMSILHRSNQFSPGLLGCILDSSVLQAPGADVFDQAFNTGAVPIRWREIEPTEGSYHWDEVERLMQFCTSRRQIIRGGPLLDLGPHGLPEWLAPWKDDFLNLPSFVCDFIETAVSRYQGHVRIWEVAARGNSGGALDLTEDLRLALVARTLEAAKRTDSDAQFFIRIDRPWGEYQRFGQHRLSPFQFVDALVRSNLGLAGVTLEINCGYGPRDCSTRDMLSISKLIDLWSLLGIQIHVNICCPSSAAPDPLAGTESTVRNGVWKDPWSEESQADWAEHIVPLLMAKPSVSGVFLSQFSDAVPHRRPHGGVINFDGSTKKIIDPLRRQLRNDLS